MHKLCAWKQLITKQSMQIIIKKKYIFSTNLSVEFVNRKTFHNSLKMSKNIILNVINTLYLNIILGSLFLNAFSIIVFWLYMYVYVNV